MLINKVFIGNTHWNLNISELPYDEIFQNAFNPKIKEY